MKGSAKTHSMKYIYGRRIAIMVLTLVLIISLMTMSVFMGIRSFKKPVGPNILPSDSTTYRKQTPTDGTLPTASTPLDNIGYMAYTLDHAEYYHVYAYNSTKSTGYEQITQSWKDYKGASLTGTGYGVMVCSDLSFSSLVKSATQSCFIGDNEAHIRTGSKPGKNSTPTDIEWNTDKPRIYDKEGYKYDYGEFSTELSVYVINEHTIDGASEVTVNADGTYSQTYYLNNGAGVWYQYGMKTRGGLKSYPQFNKIDITFTFDANWRVLSSYCEERATISPRALGGVPMDSTSKTTTEFDYGSTETAQLSADHFKYFDEYFKDYVGAAPAPDNNGGAIEVGVLDVLGGGFGEVVNANGNGQQFKLDLTVGDTEYDGTVYLKLIDMSNVLGTLDARVELEKKGSGKQDLYIEFRESNIRAYYGTDFALTGNIGNVAINVKKIINYIEDLKAKPDLPDDGTDDKDSSGINLDSLLTALVLTMDDINAYVTIQSDNLLDLGIGIDACLGFDRKIEEDGGSIFAIRSVDLNYIGYNGTPISVKASIVPDKDGKIISRDAASTPADLAKYIDSVYKVLKANTVKVDISLEDKLVEGLTLDAAAYIKIATSLAADAELAVSYRDISLKLKAHYLSDDRYGDVYLNLTEFNGKATDAKIYCNIADVVDEVKEIITLFGGASTAAEEQEQQQSADKIASIINSVLSLDFGKVLGNIKGDADNISLDVNIDPILSALGVTLGIDFGTAQLNLSRAEKSLTGALPELGLTMSVSGSDVTVIPAPDKTEYVDVAGYIQSVKTLIGSPSYDITLALTGTGITDELDLTGLEVLGTASIGLESDYSGITVNLPLSVSYGDISLKLTLNYGITFADGNYGAVYVNVTELNGSPLDAKLYCDIKEVVTAVKDLINLFAPADQPENAPEQGDVSEKADVISSVVALVAGLDLNDIVRADSDKLDIALDLDYVLNSLNVALGVKLGTVKLNYNRQQGVLSGSLPAFGLEVSVSGGKQPVEKVDGSDYIDLAAYINSVTRLVSSNVYVVKLSFEGTAITDGIDLTGLKLDGEAQVALSDDYKNITVNAPVTAEYKGVSLSLEARYTIDLQSGNYGKVYIAVTAFNGRDYDAKVYCDISNTVEAVNGIISLFRPATPAVTGEEGEEQADGTADILSKVIAYALSLDYNEVVSATQTQLNLSLDLDEALTALDISLGVSLGSIKLTYSLSRDVLQGELSALGLAVTVSGREQALPQFDGADYVDVVKYIESAQKLLESNSYTVDIAFDGSKITDKKLKALNALTLSGTAQLALDNGFKDINVTLPVTASYGEITLSLTVHYNIAIGEGGYGTAYINVTEFNGNPLDARLYCDVAEAVQSIKSLISLFSGRIDGENPQDTAEGEGVDILANAIALVLNLDYNGIINATNQKLSVNLDIDAVLSGLGIDLGVSLGSVALDYSVEQSTLSGSLPALGLEVNVQGSNNKLAGFDTQGYISLTKYIDEVSALISSKTYDITLAFTGGKIAGADLSGLSLSGTAKVGLSDKLSSVQVTLPLSVQYKEVSVKAKVDYTINLSDGGMGTVYLHLTEVNGNAVDAKVYCNVKDTVSAVKKLINMFAPQVETEDSGIDLGGSSDIISSVIALASSLNFKEIISATDEQVDIVLDVDDILSGLGVSLGFSLGTVTLNYQTATGVLSGSVPALGVTLSGCGSDEAMPALDTAEYIDVVPYLKSVTNLLDSKTYIVNVNFTGAKIADIDLTALKLNGAASVAFDGNYTHITVHAPISVEYSGVTAELTAHYSIDVNSGNYGVVYLNITSICGQQVQAKVYCDIADTVDAVKNIIAKFVTETGTSGGNPSGSKTDSADIAAKAIAYALSLDYNSIIRGTRDSLNVTLDIDGALAALGINLGIGLGEVQLTYNVTGDSLSGKLPALGLALSVSGSQRPMTVIDADGYIDIAVYLDSVQKLLESNSYFVALSLDGQRAGDDLETINDIKVEGVAQVALADGYKKIAVDLPLVINYQDYEVKLNLYYTINLDDGNYGTIYLTITEFNGKALDARVYCDIAEVIDAVKGLVGMFEGAPVITLDSQPKSGNDVIANVVALALSLDYNKLISATAQKVSVNMDIDGLFAALNISLGLKLGEVSLEYNVAKRTLEGSLAELGLELSAYGSDKVMPQRTFEGYVNVVKYINDVTDLINSKTYTVTLSLDGTKIASPALSALKGISADGTAEVAIKQGLNMITVNVDLTVSYDNSPASGVEDDIFTVKLSAHYDITLSNGDYGKLYLTVKEIGGKVYNAKVYCSIGDAVDAINSIIARFTAKAEAPVAVKQDDGQGKTDMVSRVIALLLDLNYSEVIKITDDNLTITLNIDGVLEKFDITLGNVALGNVVLVYDANNNVISGKVDDIGLSVTVVGSPEEDLAGYPHEQFTDINYYIDALAAIVDSNTYLIDLSFDGSAITDQKLSALSGLKLTATTQAAVTNGYNNIDVCAGITATYNYTSKVDAACSKVIKAVLNVYYSIDISTGGYGNVYVELVSVNGSPVGAKVYVDIADAITSIKDIIALFATADEDGEEGATAPAAQESEQAADIIAQVIGLVIGIDYDTIIGIENNCLNVNLDVDMIASAFGISLGGIQIENVALTLDAQNKALTGNVQALGAQLTVKGSDKALPEFNSAGYVNANGYINSVKALLSASAYKVTLAFTGTKLSEKVDLSGLSITAEALVAQSNGFKAIDVYVNNLTVDYCGITVKLNAYYSIELESGNFGTVFITVTEVYGTALSAKVYCNVSDTVSVVKDIIALFNEPEQGGQSAEAEKKNDIISQAIGYVLSFNYSDISATDKLLTATVDVDNALSAFGIDIASKLGGIKLGTVTLGYSVTDGALTGALANIGLNSITLCASDSKLPAKPSTSGYLDAATLLDRVKNAAAEVKAISEGHDVEFNVGANVTILGTPVAITGNGEAVWADGAAQVALALTLATDGKTVDINFFYDGIADAAALKNGTDALIVTLTINDTGLKIYRSEITNFADGFNAVIEAINGNSGTTVADEETAPAAEKDKAAFDLAELVKNDNVNRALTAVLQLIGKLTVTLESTEVDDATLVKLLVSGDKLSLGLSADSGIALNVALGDTTLSANVSAGDGSVTNSVVAQLNAKDSVTGADKYDYKDLTGFARVMYEYAISRVEEVSLAEILGEYPYAVDLTLNGSLSGIAALDGVKVNATLYYDEGRKGSERTTKLIRTDLTLEIDGTPVEASLILADEIIYIELSRIGANVFGDLKFKCHIDNIFNTAEELIRVITDTNIIPEIIKLLKGDSQADAAQLLSLAAEGAAEDGNEQQQQQSSTLAKLITALLTFDIDDAYRFDEETYTLVLNIDEITDQVFGISLGTLTAKADAEQHTLTANVQYGSKNWLSINARPAETDVKEMNSRIDYEAYTDVNFLAYLVKDAVNTLTDDRDVNNKAMYKLFTFTGDIDIKVSFSGLNLSSIDMKNVKLTIGLDRNDSFYFTLTADLQKSSVIILGDVTKERKISVTFANGYLVLGRNVDSSSEEYKVMTVDYLLDNLFTDDSPIKWLIGSSSGVWGVIKLATNSVSLDSGLTKPRDYYLYEMQNVAVDNKINIGDYISGYGVTANKKSVSTYKNGASKAISKFGLTDNYYAFDINGDALTGGVIPTLYAALTRSDDTGINGLKAYVEVSSFVKLTLNLTNYLEGATVDYDKDGNLLTTGAGAPNYYDYCVNNTANKFDPTYDKFEAAGAHTTPKFGCFSTADGVYEASQMLEKVYVDVYSGIGGTLEKTVEVTYSSTLHLVSDFPEMVAGTSEKLTYVNADGVDLSNQIVIEDGNKLFEIVYFTNEDGTKVGRISIYRSSEAAEEVVFVFVGFDGMHDVHAALGADDELKEYPLAGYSFLGWYQNSALTGETVSSVADIINTVNGVKTVYGKYILREVEIDGIVYEFDTENNCYFVSRKTVNASGYYYKDGTSEAWLVLADHIGIYPVKYIAANALANANSEADEDGYATSLVRVVVPASITAVYENAFGDNKKLQTVVFLADKVFLAGKDDGDTKTTVFYGCYINKTTGREVNCDLTVYYVGLENTDPFGKASSKTMDSNWNRCFYESVLFVTTVVKANTNGGDWIYVTYNITGYEDNGARFFNLIDGLYSSVDVLAVKASVNDKLNTVTAPEGVINAYNVYVTESVSGRLHSITVNITLDLSNAYYLFEATALTRNTHISGNFDDNNSQEYGGSMYVKAGMSIAIKTTADNAALFSSVQWTASGVSLSAPTDKMIMLRMPANPVSLSVEWIPLKSFEVSVYSAVAFGCEEQVTALGNGNYTVSLISGSNIADVTLSAEGYIFLGYATLSGTTLSTVSSCTVAQNMPLMYALWAQAKSGITGATLSGTTLTATVDGVNAASVYGWYTDSSFTNPVALCSGNVATVSGLTADTTILYARLVYNLTVNWTGSSSAGNNYLYVNDSTYSTTGYSLTYTFNVLEGETVTQVISDYSYSGSFGRTTTVSSAVCTFNSVLGTTKLMAKKNGNNGNTRSFNNASGVLPNGTTEFVITGNLILNYTF